MDAKRKATFADVSAAVIAGDKRFVCILNNLHEVLEAMRNSPESSFEFNLPEKIQDGCQYETSIGVIRVRILPVFFCEDHHHSEEIVDNFFIDVLKEGQKTIAWQFDMHLKSEKTSAYWTEKRHKGSSQSNIWTHFLITLQSMLDPSSIREKIIDYKRGKDFSEFERDLFAQAIEQGFMTPLYKSGKRMRPAGAETAKVVEAAKTYGWLNR